MTFYDKPMYGWANNIIVHYSTLQELHDLYEGKVILTNGCFDLFNAHHLTFLNGCYANAPDDYAFVVAINSDESVRSLKGNDRPIIPFEDRAHIVSCIKSVDYVIELKETRMNKIFEALKPEIWIKGGDYDLESIDQGERQVLESLGVQIKFTGRIDGPSTSDLISKIQKTKIKNKY